MPRTKIRYDRPIRAIAPADEEHHVRRTNHAKARQAYRESLQFEAEVRSALEALGYGTSPDELQVASQIDLVAHHRGPIFEHKLIVECKNWEAPVSVSTVRELAGIVDSLSTKASPVHGMIVSKVGFTKEAKSFAASSGIEALTLSDLSTRAFDTKPVIENTVVNFESGHLSTAYVDLSCQINEQGTGTIYKPVEKFLDEFLATTSRRGVAVLGNFGSGKTSLCQHYAYLLAQRWKEGGLDRRMPIFVHLRELPNLHDLESEVLRIINKDYKAEATLLGWRQWLRKGRTLLLLDGFDEMASGMDRVTIRTNLAALGQFTEQNSLKFILSCRTHFFRTRVEEDTLGNVLRLYMCDWGRSELTEYVRHSAPDQAPDIIGRIDSTYNLNELSRTPIFLSMIVESVDGIRAGLNQAKLYQIYTDRWIESQEYRSQISPEEKRHFMEELAFEMFIKDETKISHHRLPESVKRVFELKDYESVSAFDRDIRTCSFLVRNSDDFYQFSHKSYSEYFLAIRLARQVKEKDTREFAQREITSEIAGFFASFFESDWLVLVRLMLGDNVELCRVNAAVSLGRLPWMPQIHDAMLLGLKTEQSTKVLIRISDALSISGREDAIVELVNLARGAGGLALHCLRNLAGHVNQSAVAALFRDILEGERDPERVCVAIEAARGTIGPFQRSVSDLLKANWWKAHEAVVSRLLEYASEVVDLAFAKLFEELLARRRTSETSDSQRRHALQALQLTFRARVESRVREIRKESSGRRNREDDPGGRKACEGIVRREFGFLIDDDQLTAVLDRTFLGTAIRITGRRSRRGMG
ncbi:MAG: restriction endonuclease [Acetobacteraceae bacterium]